MEPLRELLASDHRQTLEFFVTGLQELCNADVDRQELLYNASVLAHHAQVSTGSPVDLPTPATLSEVFDSFVFDTSLIRDSTMMEAAGAQCLLLAGFFEDQMKGRHQIEWYAKLGAGFYDRAAAHERSIRKAKLLDAIARRFEPWRQRHSQLSRELRDQQYLLTPPKTPWPPGIHTREIT
jgi:hypothetical protein